MRLGDGVEVREEIDDHEQAEHADEADDVRLQIAEEELAIEDLRHQGSPPVTA